MDNNLFENIPGKPEKLDIKVEIATEKDLAQLRDLRLLAIQSDEGRVFAATPESIAKELAYSDDDWHKYFFDKNGFAAVSRQGSQIVGMGLAFRKFPNGDSWHMRAGYLKKEFRKLGYGGQMFAARLKEIIRLGGKDIILNIRAGNEDSMAVALKFGFKKISSGSETLASGEKFDYDDMELKNLDDSEVIKKIDDVLDAG